MIKTTSMISDDEGEAIGGVGSYINRFKDIETRGGNSSDLSYMYSPSRKGGVLLNSLPKKWDNNTKEEILCHYYTKLGDGTLSDTAKVSTKISKAINRAYSINVTSDEIERLLSNIDKDTLSIKETISLEKECIEETNPKESIAVNLPERSYDYIPNKEPISNPNLELVPFINPDLLCFSSKGDNNFYLALKNGNDNFEF